MRRIFGAGKKAAPAPTLDESCERMDLRNDKVEEKIKKLEDQLMKYREQIRKTRPGAAQDAIKRRAIQLMKQKKLYEGQQSQIMAQQFNMEQTRFTVDNIKDTVGTVQGLTAAQKEMKSMMKNNKELDLNYIDKMQDKMYDMMDISNEINETMSRSYDVPDDLDESDLMAELDGLESDMTFGEAEAGGAPSYLQEPDVELPSAPTKEPEVNEQELGLPAMKT
ncbi:Snf7 family [Dunaliella salina]|uniref:Snf7 family n=1 Tax=Dunaliella salina TaxID=3046 RepID=A0ABQ7GZ48_DUNSA|nr:Snf7 family [Dunaliella salina]|eukprot:KAF5839881.1 Snf7 family [Dunaliella salina]